MQLAVTLTDFGTAMGIAILLTVAPLAAGLAAVSRFR